MISHSTVAYGDIFNELKALSQALGFKTRLFAGQSACAT
jgi:hypothetical protein